MNAYAQPFRVALGGIAVLLCLFLAACGGGSDSTTSAAQTLTDSTAASGPLTKAQFLKQGNKICAHGVKKKEQLLGAVANNAEGGEASQAELVGVVEQIVPVYSETVSQLDELAPPSKDEAAIDKMVKAYEKALEETADNPAAALKATPFDEPNVLALKYGLTSCEL